MRQRRGPLPDVIAPNFKRRLSGVTSTIVQLLPLQARTLSIAALGPGLPEEVPRVSWAALACLMCRPRGRPFRIWHARRNIETVVGLLLRDVLRARLRIVFTSAAQRDHRPFTKWMLRRVDAVIATSDRSASYLEVPFTVIRHGVDMERFHPPRSPADRAVTADIPGRFAIGCFGRIRRQKGTDLFVEAMIDLLPDRPDWTAVISGRVTVEHRDFARKLRERVDASGLSQRILFIGEVPDITAWYRAIDVLVAPSRNEGFGLTPIEAMASGLAVVASDAGAYPEIVVPGTNGALVPAGDPAALTAAIAPYLDDPELRRDHATAGRAFVEKEFSLRVEAEAIAAVYERLWSGGEAD